MAKKPKIERVFIDSSGNVNNYEGSSQQQRDIAAQKRISAPAMVQVAQTVKPTMNRNLTQPTIQTNDIRTVDTVNKQPKEEQDTLKEALKKYGDTIKNSATKNQGFSVSNAISDIANLNDATKNVLKSIPGIGNYYKGKDLGRKNAVNVATNMATGAIGTMEKASDAASDLVFNPIEQRYNYAFDYLTKGKKTADENLKDLKEMQARDIKKNRTEKFLEDTGYNDIADELEKGSAVKRNNILGQIAQGTGGMVPALVLGQAFGGAPELTDISNLQGKERLATALGNVGKTYMSQLPSNAILGASSYGSGMEEALNNGASMNRARAYGLTNAGIEQLTEMLTGGVPGLEGKGGIDQFVEPLINRNTNGYLNALLRAGYGALGEGLEESTGAYLDALAKRGILGQDIDWNEVNREALQSGLVGAATGAILNAPSTTQDFQGVRTENQLRNVLGDAEYAEGRGQYNPDYKGWESQREENRIENEKRVEENTKRREEFERIQQQRQEEARKAQELVQERQKEQERIRQQEETNRALEARKTLNTDQSDYDKYYKKNNLKDYDSTITEKAKETIASNKQGRRTKQEWLDVAKNIGMQSKGMDAEALKKYAYESFKAERPNIKENLNRQGQKYVSFKVDEWVDAVQKAAQSQSSPEAVQSSVETEQQTTQVNNKQKQLEIINNSNPMQNEYHTGIRNENDIKTFDEAIQDDESFVWGDYSKEDAERDLQKGTVTVYSSKPIEQGAFVSTSKNQARDYAGGGKIYSQEVPINDVAWINGDEGQYAKVENTQKTTNKTNITGYHGTDSDFENYSFDNFGKHDKGDLGKAIYFAKDKNTAKKYGSIIKENNLSLNNPLILNNKADYEKMWHSIAENVDKSNLSNEDIQLLEDPYTPQSEKDYLLYDTLTPEQKTKLFQKMGYDGIIDNSYGQIAVFDEKQLNQKENIPAEMEKEPVIKVEEKQQKIEKQPKVETKEEVEGNEDILDEEKQGSKILNEVPKAQRPKLTERVKRNIYKLRQKFTDHQAAIYDMSREYKNPTLLHKADAIMSADNLAQNMLEKRQVDLKGKAYNNFTDEKGNKVSMGFEKAYDLYKNIPNEAKSEFLVHMRNIDQLNYGLDQFDIPLKESQERVAELRKEYKDIDKWGDNIWTYGHNQLKNIVDSGLKSEAIAQKYLESNPHYVRIQRNVPNNSSSLEQERNNVKIKNPIQKVKGSNIDIMPIKETQAQFTRDVMKAIKLNEFGQELTKTIGVSSDGGEITSIDEMFGVDQKVLDGEDGNYTFTIFDKGRPVTIPISEGIYDSLKIRKITEVPVLSDITKFQREVLTNKNPYFAMTNAVKDFGDMMLYSKFPVYKSFGTYMELFGGRTLGRTANAISNKANNTNNVTKTQHWVELYENRGNLSNSIFTNGEFRKQPGKVGKVVGAPLRGIEAANNFIESMPRITEFVNTIKSNGYDINSNGDVVSKRELFIEENKNKLSKEELEKRASKIKEPTKSLDKVLSEADYNAAEVTTNFKRGGEVAKTIDKNGGTFFSASVQGASKLGRTFTEAFGDAKSGDFRAARRLFSRAMALGVLPALINKIAYDKDKDYEELSDYVKEQYYLFKVKGTDKFIRIPKGRAVSLFESGARRGMETAQGKKDAWKGYGSLIENQIAPNNPLDSNILAPWSAVKNNRSWSGNQIVSDYLEENYNPDQQYDAKTSEFSKWVGKKLKNVPLEDVPLAGAYLESIKSPKKLDYLLDQYSGVIGDIALPSMTNYAESEGNSGFNALTNPLKSKFETNSTLNNRTVNDYYTLKSKSIKDSNNEDATNLQKAQKEYIAGKYSDISSHLSSLYSEQREIQNDTTLSDSEKYKQNKAKQREIVDYMKQVINNMNNAKEENGVVTIGDKTYVPGKTSWGEDTMKVVSEAKTKAAKDSGLSLNEYSKLDSHISNIEADKDSNGKSVRGSVKKKAIAYLRESGYTDEEIKPIVEGYGWKFKEGD